MKGPFVVALLLFLASGLAVGQAVVPMPNIVDHQTQTNAGPTTYTMTENIASDDNIVMIVVACDYSYSTYSEWPCVAAASPPTDGTITFSLVDIHYSDSQDWTEETFFAIFPTTGSKVITFTVPVTCSLCTWKTMVEQVQGIGANDRS